ncbi:MAG: glucosamine-6-phosphate deaminase [Sedimentisphaerales bacterium]|nr:glucosamine-6-phosphate deaminase [Sedimentisphaerales bacterium]
MERFVFSTKEELGQAAAEAAAKDIVAAIQVRGQANIILATGASQFATLQHLITQKVIDFSAVVMFHLDEYIGLGIEHPASFRKYLKERFVDRLDSLKAYHFVNGDAPNPAMECSRLSKLIQAHPIDVALVGIGENGHLAFNDPPADFETEEPYLVVELDEKCRRQQLGEGWFPALEDVPQEAISMSIRQILKSQSIVVSVPDRRKAEAVKGAVEGPVTNLCPSSILQQHRNCRMYLDSESASLLTSCN